MNKLAVLLLTIALLDTGPALADIDQISAREVARNNNCTPTKIDIFQQSLGSEGKTVYKVSCVVAKVSEANAPKGADALLVSCKDSLCVLVRPLISDDKK